jgi:hypothetical protein
MGRNELVAFRKECFEGLDWVYEPSRRVKSTWKVLWTPLGMMKVKIRFNLAEEEVEEVEEQISVAAQEWDGVVTSKARNPRIIMCRVGKEEVKVLVRDNSKFVVGMKVPLRKDAGRWVAKRHPRFGGKW